MYFVKTPSIAKPLYRDLIWNIKTHDPVLYLTFDDGPTPGITKWVLEELERYGAKATFFCIGDKVARHPDLYRMIKSAGHCTGNHSYNHLNGWNTPDDKYIENIEQCKTVVASRLFRPPYGKASRSQIKKLKDKYRIIMWDVLSGDFDSALTPEQCAENVIRHASKGSIVVFHDSEKAQENMMHALTETLKHFTKRGMRFESLAMLNASGT